jgi:NADH pyrophosphatase NudC (nudix superfamily)
MPPTEPEVLRDAKALLHGKKEGEIVIEAHAKHTTPAEKTIVDNTNMPHHATFKETELGEFCDNCGCENHEHHKFCHGCGKQLV